MTAFRPVRLGGDVVVRGTVAAGATTMTSTGTKGGFALAWLLGIPLPILLVIYLISRC